MHSLKSHSMIPDQMIGFANRVYINVPKVILTRKSATCTQLNSTQPDLGATTTAKIMYALSPHMCTQPYACIYIYNINIYKNTH